MGGNADAGGQHTLLRRIWMGKRIRLKASDWVFYYVFKRMARRFGSGDTQYSEFCSLCRWISLGNRWA